MTHKTNKKGFTLVEIMIVVVIIGLLAAMAIPAFNKVRRESIEKTVVNDGRQIGSAAQQYFTENGVALVTITGVLVGSGPEANMRSLSKGVQLVSTTVAARGTFALSHAALDGTLVFTDEGRLVE